MEKIQNFYFGTWQLSKQFNLVTEAQVREILTHALMAGIKYFDTASVYGNGAVESQLGLILPLEANIVTKIPAMVKPMAKPGNISNYYPLSWLEQSWCGSLERLKRDTIYGVLLHNWSEDWNDECAEVMSFLTELKAQNKVQKIGISMPNNFSGQLPAKVLEAIDIIEAPSNRECNWVDHELAVLQDNGIEVILRSLFLQGKVFEVNSKPDEYCEILHRALLKQCSIVIGMTKKHHIDKNVKTLRDGLCHG